MWQIRVEMSPYSSDQPRSQASTPSFCTLQQASRDISVQVFPPLFVLQATKAGCGGLGTKVAQTTIIKEMHFVLNFTQQVISELYIMIQFVFIFNVYTILHPSLMP